MQWTIASYPPQVKQVSLPPSLRATKSKSNYICVVGLTHSSFSSSNSIELIIRPNP